MTAEDVIRTHTQAFNVALLAQDVDALAAIYTDDYMLVRPDGSVLSKDDVLDDLEHGGLRFTSIDVADARVRLYGPTALLTAESWTVSSRAGQETRARIRLLAVYVADGSRVRLAHFQSVPIPT